MDKTALIQRAHIELARREFWEYAKLVAPSFYKDSRPYLHELCNELQAFIDSKDTLLLINLPPRHGKSRTVTLFTQWLFGKNINNKIMTASYNETLSTTFSKSVRNTISETKADKNKVVYADIFPGTKIKRGDASMNLWSLEGGYNNYLATSPSGTATGFGASMLIIDDLIKSAEEAYNGATLDKHWEWYNNTMLSRLEEHGKIIVIMTRWGNNDLAGRLIRSMQEQGTPYKHINYKAYDNGTMLCEEVLSYTTYKLKTVNMNKDIVAANYNQTPIDIKGRLYGAFKTYTTLPEYTKVKAYVDTADKGKDYLCAIIYAEHDNEAYVLNILYTQDGMETTEPELAKRLHTHKANQAIIESNNGGEGFARNVRRLLKTNHNSNKCSIEPYHQSKNKEARILSNSTWCTNHIHMPENWADQYPEFYQDITNYQKAGKNTHDDCADALTGVAEQFNRETTQVVVLNANQYGL